MASNGNGNGRILTRDLDVRLTALEQKIGEMAEHLSQLELHARDSQTTQQETPAPDEAGDGRLAELEAQVTRLDERVEKITQTLVSQASRWA